MQTSTLPVFFRWLPAALLALLLLLAGRVAQAQAVTDYSVTGNTGQALASMSGATTVLSGGNNGTVIAAGAASPIGFTFTFGGTAYTQFWVNTRTELRFGNASPGTNIAFPTAANTPGVSPASGPYTTGSDGSVSYRLMGAAPNRVLVVDWKVGLSINTTADKEFQVWLSEGSNTIRFVYDINFTHSSSGFGCGAGIATDATTFKCLNLANGNTSTTAVPEVAQRTPAAGQFYLFDPAPAPTVTGFSPASGPSGSTVTVTGTDFTNVTSVRFGELSATFNVLSPTQLTAVVPRAASTQVINVTTTAGSEVSPTAFAVTRNAILTYTLVANNFAGVNVGSNAAPAVADLDGDGRLDLLVGRGDGTIARYEQAGINSTTFSGPSLLATSGGTIDRGTEATVAIVDTDSDGKFNVLLGGHDGYVYDYEQTAVGSTTFMEISNFVGQISTTSDSAPSVTNLDGDSRLEIVTGKGDGIVSYAEQNSRNSLAFSINNTDYLNLAPARNTAPFCVDLDGNGRVDVLIGVAGGNIYRYEQGAANNTTLTQRTSVFNSIDVGTNAKPCVTDIDGDGLLDLLIGRGDGTIDRYEQTPPPNTAPTDISLSNASVAENQAVNTAVGTLSTTDANAGDTFTYTFASGGPDNGSFNIIGNTTLTTNRVFDFENKSSYTVRLRSTDQGGLFFDKDFTITVNDVSEVPTITSFTPTSGAAGTSVVITGTNFTSAGAATVGFNGTTATTVAVNSNTQLTATVPAGATTGRLTVQNADGTATSSTDFTVPAPNTSIMSGPGTLTNNRNVSFVFSSDQSPVDYTTTGNPAFTYVGNGPNSTFGPIPDGTYTLSVAARNTSTGLTDATPATYTFTVDATAPTVVVSSTAGASGGSTGTSPIPFTVTFSENVLNFVNGDVTVTGGTLTSISAASGSVYNLVVTPTAPGSVVTVSIAANVANDEATNGNTASNAYSLTYAPAPTITSFTPTSGLAGTSVTITGTGFIGFITVAFNGTGVMGLTGSSTQINTTVPTGATTGFITVTTPSGTATSSSVFTVPVNQAPVVTVPATQNTAFNTAKVFSTANGNALSVADADAGSGALSVYITVGNGTATVSTTTGLTFNGSNGSGSFGFSGTLANINAALNGLTFSPNNGFTGAASLQLSADDQGNTGSGGAKSDSKTVTINVTVPVNQAPVVTVPATQSTPQNTAKVFSSANGNALSVADADAGSGQLEIYLGAVNGAITLGSVTGITFNSGSSNGSGSMTIRGTLTAINNALNGLSFAPNSGFIGAASLQLSANDLGNTGSGGAKSDSETVTINVVDTQRPSTVVTSTAGATGGSTNTSPIPFTITFSENVTGFGVSDVTVTGGTFTANAVSGTVYTLQVTPTGPGSVVTVSVAANVANDVAGNGNTASNTYSLTYTPAPIITSLTPSSGPVGTSVVIAGSGFTGATGVTFNGTPAASFVVNSGSQITAVAVAGTSTGAVVVTTPAGTSNTNATFTVTAASTSTALTSSANPSVFGQNVTFTATVTNTNGSATPAGTVTFKDGSTTITTGPLNAAGVSSFSTSGTTVGSHSMTVVYSPATGFSASTSAVLNQVVNPAATTVALTSSVNPSTLGQSVTFTATVATTAPGTGTPSPGTVTFKDGTTTLGTASTNGIGVATYATSALTVGSHSITAVYSANTNYAASTSAVLTQVVNPAAPVVTSVAGPAPGTYRLGQFLTFLVSFDQPVTVSTAGGTPVMILTIGSTPRGVTYLSGSTTNTLTFRYLVQAGDLDTNGVTLGNSIAPNNGTLRNATGTDAVLTLNNVSALTSVLVDGVVPTATVTTTAANPSSTSLLPITITFSEPVTGLTAAGITVTNGIKGALSGSGTTYTLNVTATASGPVTVLVSAGAAQDAAANPNPQSNTLSVTYTPPPVAISSFTPTSGAAGTVVVITGTGFSGATSVTINNGAVASYTVDSNTQITATVAATNTTGLIRVVSPAGSGASSTNFVVGPAVTAVTATANGSYKAGQTISFFVTFSQAVTVTGTPSLGLTVGSAARTLAYASGSGTNTLTFSYVIMAGDLDPDGVQLSTGAIALNGGTIRNSGGAAADLDLDNVAATTGLLVDAVAPTVAISNSAGTTTSTAPIPVTVTFSESVTGFVAGDVTVGNGTITGGSFGGSGSTYTFTITPTANGAVTVDIAANAAQDAATNGNTAASQLSIQYTAPVAPNTSIVSGPGTVTNSRIVGFLFSSNQSPVSYTTTGGPGLTYASNGASSAFGPLADGTYTLGVAARNTSTGLTDQTPATYTFTVDTQSPTVAITSAASNPTSSSPFMVTITFAEPVTGFALADILVSNGTASNLAGSGTTYTASITPAAAGTVTVDVPANAAQDAATNGNTAAPQFSVIYGQLVTAAPTVDYPTNASTIASTTPTYTGTAPAGSLVTVYLDNVSIGSTTATAGGSWSLLQPSALGQGSYTVKATAQSSGAPASGFSAANTFTVDTQAPTATISSTAGPSGGSTSYTPIPYSILFSEAVTGFAVTGLTVSGGTAGSFVVVSPTQYTFSVTPTGAGTVEVSIAPSVAQDGAGNDNVASTTYSLNYVPVFTAAPVITSPFDRQYFTTAPATPTYTGTAPAGSLVTVYLGGNLLGTTFADAAGNWSFVQPYGLGDGFYYPAATAQSPGEEVSPRSSFVRFAVDTVPPSVPVVTSPTNGSFLTTNQVTFTGTSSTGGGSGVYIKVYVDNVLISSRPLSGFNWSTSQQTISQGVHTVTATATDIAGNTSAFSTPVTFTVDSVVPTATISSTAGNSGGSTATSPIPYTVTFSEAVTGFAVTDLTVSGGTAGSFVVVSATQYTFSVTPSGPGTLVEVSIAAAAAADVASNPNPASAIYSLTYGPPTTGPTITNLSAASELPGMPVVVTGTGFSSASTATVGGVAASVTYTSANSLTVLVPATAAVGSSTIIVTTNGVPSTSAPAFSVLKVYDAAANCLSTASYLTTGDNQWHYLLAGGQVVAALRDTDVNLGTVSLDFLVTGNAGAVRQDARGRFYFDRNFHLTASGGTFVGSSVDVRFYGLLSELNRLNAADPTANASTLKATQYSGPNEDCNLSNNSAAGESRVLPLAASAPGNGVPWFMVLATVADHFSEFYLSGSSTPLPVELVSFTAEVRGSAVALAWRTASEKNSARFEVERSLDGRTFASIGQVAAQGSKASPTNYTFQDSQFLAASAAPRTAYYRLRQVDADGTASYSPVRTVTAGGPAALALFPNPTHGGAATLTGAAPGTAVTVLDALGREVLATTADAAGTAVLLPLRGLATGIYVVRAGSKTLRLTVE
jgi:hypothetical protein